MPSLFVGTPAVPHRRGARVSLRGAAGPPGAVQLPDRGDLAVHHLRRLVRLRAPGRAGARPLVRAAAGHHHPLLARRGRARRSWPSSAATRSCCAFIAGRGAVAGRRPALDADDDGCRSSSSTRSGWRDRSSCTGGGGRRGDHRARAARSGARCDPGRGPGRAAAPADGRGHDPARIPWRRHDRSSGRASRSTAPPPAGWACPRRPRGASPSRTRW